MSSITIHKTEEQQAISILKELPVLKEKLNAVELLKDYDAEMVLAEVLCFLNLIYISSERLTPSLPIDLVWHEFILCTKLYQRHCENYYGRFIHHHPGGNEKENQQNFKRTLQLYYQHYGEPPAALWGPSTYIDAEKAECGSCDGL